MNSTHYLCLLCLVLSNDVHPNPGPLSAQQTLTCIGCKAEVNGTSTPGLPDHAEWIWDSCFELMSANYNFDQSVDEIIQGLPKGIFFGHLNVCGLRSKLDQFEIKILLCANSFDVFAISESKLDSNIDDTEILIKGFKLVRRDRNRHRDGLLFYIKDKWTISKVQINSTLEMISLDIKLLNSPIMKV